jgi:hypothetical protein
MIDYPDTNWAAQEQAYRDDLERERLWTGGYAAECECCGTPLLSDEEERGLCDNCSE